MVDIVFGSKLWKGGALYQPHSRSPRDSNVIIRNVDFNQVPARILAIFSEKLQPEKPSLLIERLVELDSVKVKQDPYQQFGFSIAGGLFLDRYHSPEIIASEALVTLFARTTFEYRTLGKVVHVLPIMKVSYVHLRYVYIIESPTFARICMSQMIAVRTQRTTGRMICRKYLIARGMYQTQYLRQ
jgi:hypothetical protein